MSDPRNERRVKKKREQWTWQEWAITLFLVVLFLPLGLAALWRWIARERVWR